MPIRQATRAQKVAHREAAIIDAAARLFAENGFSKTTISGIAKASGVADGTVYLYFENKDALARATVDSFYTRLTETGQAAVDAAGTIRDRLTAFGENHVRQLIEDWRLIEMMPVLNMTFDTYEGSQIHQYNKAYTTIFDRMVRDGRTQGVIREDVALRSMRDIFFGGLDYGCRTVKIRGGQGLSELVADLVTVLCVETPRPSMSSRLEQVTERLEAAADRIGA